VTDPAVASGQYPVSSVTIAPYNSGGAGPHR
jgi:hypothetical protein